MKRPVAISVLLMFISVCSQAQHGEDSLLVVSTQNPSESSEIVLGAVSGLTMKPSLISSESTVRKEVILAAREDAAIFDALNGAVEKSAELVAAFEEVQKLEGAKSLSEVEQARVIVLLSDMK